MIDVKAAGRLDFNDLILRVYSDVVHVFFAPQTSSLVFLSFFGV